MKTDDSQLKLETKGVWIPICIWDNKELTLQEKAILVKVESFKECFASNDYLAEFVNVSVSRVKQVLKSLEDKGYIYRVVQRKEKVIVKRIISVDKAKFYGIAVETETYPNSDIGQETVPSKDRKLSHHRAGNCPDNSKASNNKAYEHPKVPASGDDTGGKKQSEKEKAQTVLNIFNDVCGHVLPKSIALNAKRQRQIQSVCKLKLADGSSPFADYNPDAWRAYFHMILENPWNTGENPSGWVATIDYATRPDTVIKTLEKKYA